MNKSEFLTCLSGRCPYTKSELDFLFKVMVDVINDGLKNDGQVRTPLGVFKKVTRKARRIRDISTGELRELPEKEIIKFKSNNILEDT